MTTGQGDSEIRRGDLFWLADHPQYSHPHVVVQDDVFNQSRITTVVVCALTTNLHLAKEPGNVLLEPGEGGLPKQSVVVVSQIASVEKSRLGERIGALSAARVDEIVAGAEVPAGVVLRAVSQGAIDSVIAGEYRILAA